MDGNIAAYEQFYTEGTPPDKIIGWQCSADGKHFADHDKKQCRYCRPIPEGFASCGCGWKGAPEDRRTQWGRKAYCPVCGDHAPIRRDDQ